MKTTNKSAQKAKKRSAILMVLSMFGIGILLGFLGGIALAKFDSVIMELPFGICIIMLLLLIAMYLQMIIHEAGHYLFGKLSGYRLISFRMGSIIFLKKGNQVVRKRYSLPGTGGQCLMLPNEKQGADYSYKWYHLGGALLNVISALLAVLLSFLFPPIVTEFAILFAIMGVILALFNGIPMCISGLYNDGMNVIKFKNLTVRSIFLYQLCSYHALCEGTTLKEQPADWFAVEPSLNWSNPVESAQGVSALDYAIEQHRFDEAAHWLTRLQQDDVKLHSIHAFQRDMDGLFLELLGECRPSVIESLYTKQVQKICKQMKFQLSNQRILYAYQLLYLKDEKMAQKALQNFEKLLKTYPFDGEIKAERDWIAYIKQRNAEKTTVL